MIYVKFSLNSVLLNSEIVPVDNVLAFGVVKKTQNLKQLFKLWVLPIYLAFAIAKSRGTTHSTVLTCILKSCSFNYIWTCSNRPPDRCLDKSRLRGLYMGYVSSTRSIVTSLLDSVWDVSSPPDRLQDNEATRGAVASSPRTKKKLLNCDEVCSIEEQVVCEPIAKPTDFYLPLQSLLSAL